MILAADESIVRYLNKYAAKSEAFDRLFSDFLQLPTMKLLPIVTCLVWLWFYRGGLGNHRIAVVQALLGTTAALLVSRLIQNLSPHRPRPIHSETLGFVLPYGVGAEADTLQDWSSFPSDTTAVAFALATGIWIASKPLGWGCLAWAAIVVGFPRIYLGFHYPSDILGGALVGVFFTLLSSLRIPMKPDADSKVKPDTYSDFIPDSVPI